MTTKQVPVTIFETKYIAKDGKEFPTESLCLFHEKELDGLVKVCPRCNGKGRINEHEAHLCGADAVGYTYEQNTYISSDPCPDCHGKGYLEKVTEWR